MYTYVYIIWKTRMIWATLRRFSLFAMLSSWASVGVSEDHGSAALAGVEMHGLGKLMATDVRQIGKERGAQCNLIFNIT